MWCFLSLHSFYTCLVAMRLVASKRGEGGNRLWFYSQYLVLGDAELAECEVGIWERGVYLPVLMLIEVGHEESA